MFHITIAPCEQGVNKIALACGSDGTLSDRSTGEIVGRLLALDWPEVGSETDDSENILNTPLLRGETGSGLTYRVDDAYFPVAPSQPQEADQEAHRQSNGTDVRRHHASSPHVHLSPRGLQWFDVRTYAGLPVSRRCINHETRLNAIAGAGFAADAGHPLTMWLTQHPHLDESDPAERVAYWNDMRQRLAVVAQKCGIPFHWLRVRESDASTHAGEHAHWMIHVPHDKVEQWTRIVMRKCPDSVVKRVWSQPGLLDYMLKAASPQTRAKNPSTRYKRSGAILGDRVAMSMSIDTKRREAAYSANPALVERREGRLKLEETDRRLAHERRITAGIRNREKREAELIHAPQRLTTPSSTEG